MEEQPDNSKSDPYGQPELIRKKRIGAKSVRQNYVQQNSAISDRKRRIF